MLLPSILRAGGHREEEAVLTLSSAKDGEGA